MANIRKIISPVTIPATTPRDGIKPDASDLEIVANIPGPGVTARTNMAMARLKIDNRLISIPHFYSIQGLILSHSCLFSRDIFK
jgi:hypothetical protein